MLRRGAQNGCNVFHYLVRDRTFDPVLRELLPSQSFGKRFAAMLETKNTTGVRCRRNTRVAACNGDVWRRDGGA